MLIQLPNGLIDGQDLFNFADIDELRGKQQNYLADKDLVVGNIGHLPKILSDMILSLQTKEGLIWKGKISEAINKLPAGDLETILIRVRENTYGSRFYHESICPHCNHKEKNLRLDLDKLALDVMSVEEQTTPKLIQLTKCKKEVELKPIFLADLFNILKVTKNESSELVTALVSVSIKRLDEKSGITKLDIDNIPALDIMQLQQELDKVKLEGSIDTKIEITCSNKDCKKEYSIKLNCFDPSFFDPTRGSPNTNT